MALAVLAWRAGFAVARIAGLRHGERPQRFASRGVSAVVLALGLYWLAERLLA